MKKVLIITAERTGSGHKASANAIEKSLKVNGIETKQIDGFELMGKIGKKMEDAYIPLTTKHPFIWKISHTFSQVFTNTLHRFIYHNCKKELLKVIVDFKPDLIISVHCMFTQAVSHLLKVNKLKIPFMINVIDLVNPPRVWRDKRADLSFLPTKEAYNQYIKLGFKPEQLVVSGFPIREDIIVRSTPKQVDGEINILCVNPSINLKKNLKIAQEIARLESVKIRFVCGLDKRLYENLTKAQQSNELLRKIEVLGYVKNMNELLDSAHILLTKAGPNMLLEGTRSGTAVVVTGHIPGQEAKNFEYITKNGYGIKCENPSKIYQAITNFITSGQLATCLKNTLKSDCNDGAKIIGENIINFLNKD